MGRGMIMKLKYKGRPVEITERIYGNGYCHNCIADEDNTRGIDICNHCVDGIFKYAKDTENAPPASTEDSIFLAHQHKTIIQANKEQQTSKIPDNLLITKLNNYEDRIDELEERLGHAFELIVELKIQVNKLTNSERSDEETPNNKDNDMTIKDI